MCVCVLQITSSRYEFWSARASYTRTRLFAKLWQYCKQAVLPFVYVLIPDIPIRLLRLGVASGLEEWAFKTNEKGPHKPHDFSMRTCTVGLQRCSLSWRQAWSLEQDVATIHLPTTSAVPTREQVGKALCHLLPWLLLLASFLFPVLKLGLHLSSTDFYRGFSFWFPLWTKGERDLARALGREGERYPSLCCLDGGYPGWLRFTETVHSTEHSLRELGWLSLSYALSGVSHWS